MNIRRHLVKLTAVVLYSLPATALAQTVNYGLGNLEGNTNLGNRPVIETIGSIINIFLGFLGVLAVVGIVWGGFLMMTSAGNEERQGTGKKAISAGVIGLAIILAAFAISSFVINQLVSATNAAQ